MKLILPTVGSVWYSDNYDYTSTVTRISKDQVSEALSDGLGTHGYSLSKFLFLSVSGWKPLT